MTLNVKQHVISGTKWNFIGQFGHYGIQFIVSLILARLLAPEEFGLVGMLTIFTSIASVFINSGLTSALIQKKNANNDDFSTVFYYNIIISLACYIVLFLSSGLIARFYEQEILKNLTRFISVVFVINSFGSVQATILQKELNFKKLNIINITGIFISGTLAVVMAFMGFGVYAIIFQSIFYALTTNLLYWISSNWKPKLTFKRQSFNELFGFGSKLLVASLLDKVYLNLDNLIIGKLFNSAQVGFFNRAKATRDLPINTSTGILSSIIFPIFSKIDNDEDLKRYHLKFLSLISYISFPLMAGLAIVAKPFTVALFSEKWLPSVEILQILCISGPVHMLSLILVQTILAKGKSGVFLKLDVYKKAIGLLGMAVGLVYGFTGFLAGITIASLISLFLNILFVKKIINTTYPEYAKAMLPSLLLSAIMGIAIYPVKYAFPDNYYILICVQIFIGIVAYFGMSYLIKNQDFLYLVNLIKERVRNGR